MFFSVFSVISVVSFCFVGAALVAVRRESVHQPAYLLYDIGRP